MPDPFLRTLEAHLIPHQQAHAFITQHHYARSAANTSVYAIGLFSPAPNNDFLLGAQLWMPTTPTVARSLAARYAPDLPNPPAQVLALSRLALIPQLPTNTASRFLALARTTIIDRTRWPILVTWADTNQGHQGTIYRADNWIQDSTTSGGDVYRDPQRNNQQVARRATRSRTRQEMLDLGYTPAPSRPKIRFVRPPGY